GARPVTPGLRGEFPVAGRLQSGVEISAGLAEGDRVLLGSVGLLRDGTPLRLAGSAPLVPPAPASAAR
ncbi:MAG: efflux RND transporter periplasmic adaptor subunit, partial [Rubrivivax sp.]|nr:efflux RND transporter periplasmic adaptor subunit [Rubrivivax sp.]